MLTFNMLLDVAGLARSDVRLLRHKDQRSTKGRSPYELWRDAPAQFEDYQSTQAFENHAKLNAPIWAAFVGTPADETLFVGLYAVKHLGPIAVDRPHPHADGVDLAGSCDEYELTPQPALSQYRGRLLIDWGPGKRSWVQRADNQDKPITELRTAFTEPEFPGYLNLISPLSKIDSFPLGWVTALKASRGIYLLTCPKTREQYVGAAFSEGGFWSRWQNYVLTGHGNNVALKSKDPSDYQVSILEVAGTSTTTEDILRMEVLWKSKLRSREMGLNKN